MQVAGTCTLITRRKPWNLDFLPSIIYSQRCPWQSNLNNYLLAILFCVFFVIYNFWSHCFIHFTVFLSIVEPLKEMHRYFDQCPNKNWLFCSMISNFPALHTMVEDSAFRLCCSNIIREIPSIFTTWQLVVIL